MAEDINSLLLQTLASRMGGSIPTSAQELLAQLGNTDPTVNLIAQYLTQRQTPEVKDNAEEEEPEMELIERVSEAESTESRSEERARAIRNLRQKADQMYAELQELRQRNDTLAAALGACYLCWGEDPHCQVCDGEGRPGSSMPEQKLFAKFISPAERRMKKRWDEDSHFPRKMDEKLSKTQITNINELKGENHERLRS